MTAHSGNNRSQLAVDLLYVTLLPSFVRKNLAKFRFRNQPVVAPSQGANEVPPHLRWLVAMLSMADCRNWCSCFAGQLPEQSYPEPHGLAKVIAVWNPAVNVSANMHFQERFAQL